VVLPWVLSVVVAYLLGSIPSGLLIGRLFYRIDVREYGSHRTGATNVLRTMGRGAAVAAVAMDFAKGALAVFFPRLLFPDDLGAASWAQALAALAVTAGHNWPIFVGFRGGRGVIVSVAAVAVMYPPMFLLHLVVAALVVWRTRYVSLASIIGAAITPPLFLLLYLGGQIPFAYVAYTIVGAIVVIVSHRDNIARLLNGTEARLGESAGTAA
jgi:glycerol-3-phosphate acyltransferase PlsY